MPLFLGERRAGWWWAVRLTLPLCLVAFAESAAPARPSLAVARPPVVIKSSEVTPPSGSPLAFEPVTIRPQRHPLDEVSDAELDRLFRGTPEKLGPAAVGRPNRGTLLNPITLESSPGIEVMNKDRSYATAGTVEAIRTAVAEVEREFPGSVLRVGDLSGRKGGYIRPHRSHQAGVDADIGFYYRSPAKWYTKANASNLDCARTWALLKALIRQGSLEYVFVDRTVQVLLREYALGIGEPREFLDDLFENPAKRGALVRHRWGHLTHFHVRFIDPVAEETGRRIGLRLQKPRKLKR